MLQTAHGHVILQQRSIAMMLKRDPRVLPLSFSLPSSPVHSSPVILQTLVHLSLPTPATYTGLDHSETSLKCPILPYTLFPHSPRFSRPSTTCFSSVRYGTKQSVPSAAIDDDATEAAAHDEPLGRLPTPTAASASFVRPAHIRCQSLYRHGRAALPPPQEPNSGQSPQRPLLQITTATIIVIIFFAPGNEESVRRSCHL